MQPPQTPFVRFNTRALVEPVTPAAIADARREINDARSIAQRVALIIAYVIFGFGFGGGALMSIIAGIAGVFSTNGRPTAGPTGIIVGLIFAVVLAILVVFYVIARRRSAEMLVRLKSFAHENNMEYFNSIAAPPLPGLLFQQGSAREASNVVRGSAPRMAEFANYQFTTGSGKNSTTHRWGYIAVRVNNLLPHIVLDAAGNGSLSSMGASLAHDQRLSLEGDFDRYFKLYCPSGYEPDALYLFTPDIMQHLISVGVMFDIELVDDWVFFYTPSQVSTLDPQLWARNFLLVQTLLTKIAQWERWRDDRLAAQQQPQQRWQPVQPQQAAAPGANNNPAPLMPLLNRPQGVASGGRRLRSGFSWKAIVIIAIFAMIPLSIIGSILLTLTTAPH